MYTTYILQASDEGIARYVGQTRLALMRRLYNHVLEFDPRWHPRDNIRKQWFREVFSRGAAIEIVPVFENLTEDVALEVERQLIQYLHLQLTNAHKDRWYPPTARGHYVRQKQSTPL